MACYQLQAERYARMPQIGIMATRYDMVPVRYLLSILGQLMYSNLPADLTWTSCGLTP